MIKDKSEKLADLYREVGNRYFRKKKFFEALVSYNKALSYAESNTKLALAYANRSAVYLECKKFEECLENIQWAKENGYPEEKLVKLNDRELKCNELKQNMANDDDDPENDPKNFFKLSHPANPKIPWMSDCIEMRKTKKYGRGLYTTKDLNAGDIIAIERSLLTSLSIGGQYYRCCNCLRVSMMNLLPCLKSASLMFCTASCRELTYKKVGDNLSWMVSENNEFKIEKLVCDVEEAFGGREQFLKFLKDNDWVNMKKTFFDFDLSDPSNQIYMQNMMKCILSLDSKPLSVNPAPNNINDRARIFANGNATIEKFANRLTGIFQRNASARAYVKRGEELIERTSEGRTLFVLKQLFNHACLPNIDKTGSDADFYYYATKPIKAGEQLFIDYLSLQSMSIPLSTRQLHFMKEFKFKCDCYYCINDITQAKLTYRNRLEIQAVIYEMNGFGDPRVKKTNAEVIDRLKDNWEFVTACSDNPRSYEVHTIVQNQHNILYRLNFLLSFPCLTDKRMDGVMAKA